MEALVEAAELPIYVATADHDLTQSVRVRPGVGYEAPGHFTEIGRTPSRLRTSAPKPKLRPIAAPENNTGASSSGPHRAQPSRPIWQHRSRPLCWGI